MNVTRQEQKHNEAKTRNDKWAALSFEAQIKYLDTTFGEGVGSMKQRKKIAEKIKIRDASSKKKK